MRCNRRRKCFGFKQVERSFCSCSWFPTFGSISQLHSLHSSPHCISDACSTIECERRRHCALLGHNADVRAGARSIVHVILASQSTTRARVPRIGALARPSTQSSEQWTLSSNSSVFNSNYTSNDRNAMFNVNISTSAIDCGDCEELRPSIPGTRPRESNARHQANQHYFGPDRSAVITSPMWIRFDSSSPRRNSFRIHLLRWIVP